MVFRRYDEVFSGVGHEVMEERLRAATMFHPVGIYAAA